VNRLKKVYLCGNTGSNNHGCEAILKGTTEILDKQNIDTVLATKEIAQDRKYGVSEFSDVISYHTITSKEKFVSRVINKLTRSHAGSEYFHQKPIWDKLKGNVALNIGGDTYCYGIPWTAVHLNKHTSSNNIPCILWGCSIEDTVISDYVKKDLDRYDLIMARESLTYQNLIDVGISEDKLEMMVDPAFVLPKQSISLDEDFFKKPVVGINLSPLVIEECPKSDMVMKNYTLMIDYILENTDNNICLVPHVYSHDVKQDLIPLTKLYEKYKSTGKVMLVDQELNCKQLKTIIAKCALFVCARTHASIAAYSATVPTLVVGYSVKSKGIAIDLFGTFENYVIPTQSLVSPSQLKDGFIWLNRNKEMIKEKLENIMPSYKKKAYDAGKIIKKFCTTQEL
jgi:colanic acid/amylovoran biosynthesis protein